MSFWNRLMSLMPTFMLFGVLIFTYSIYYITNLKPNFNGYTYEIIILHCIIILFMVSMFRAMFLQPGIISTETIDETWKQWEIFKQQEKDRLTEEKQRRSQKSVKTFKTENDEDRSVVNLDAEEIIEEEDNANKDQNQKAVQKRFCKKCCIPKPPRAHHCSQCNTCWQRMDHHCQWINNCVARDNYKMFFCMIFYASALLVWVTISQYQVFEQVIHYDASDLELYIIVLHFYFVCFLAVLISGFFIFHVYLTSQNKTTLEQLEDKPDKTKYDQGIWLNFQSALGSNILFWLIPI
ncbi:unnamed protein product [Paramecium octaurelia]|uniref:Palmitoyltransferase n=1 Tax=Paramecium octaurelia TaxID=43137 RepID=A0A8S1SBD2_PAROT|nr:unnamed protein product [Paramecium octaurelia]